MTCVGSNKVIVLGGTAGTGKTSIAEVLYKNLQDHSHYGDVEYIEGDSLHPQANVEKMSHGIPLDDDDRWGWLKEVSNYSSTSAKKHKLCIATCSSLKKKYRDCIRDANSDIQFYFIILHGSIEEITRRVTARHGHFMKANMIESQFKDLELPVEGKEENCFVVELDGKEYKDINQEVETLVNNKIL